jgi:murein DD-endopeptidase MepM/ murein hydrolase activator NlpD
MRKILWLLPSLFFLPILSVSAQSPNYGSGFTSTGLSLNGGATITSSGGLQLTDGGGDEARTAFFDTLVNVQSFTNDFTFQVTNAYADGLTFAIQSIGPASVGRTGGGLGYAGIGNSVAVGFQLYSAGYEVSLTGDWTNGASPDATPGSSTTGSGVNFHSGDVMSVHMTYDGTTLTWTITDTKTGKSFTKSVTINIPALTGSTAYVGFTGGSGGLTAVQNILTWTYTSGAFPSITTPPANQTVAPGQTASFSVVATGTAPLSYQWQQNTGTGFISISGATSSTYTTPATISADNGTTFDVIVRNTAGSVTSSAATLTVSSGTVSNVNYGSGFTSTGLSLNGGATITSSGGLQLTDGGGDEARTAFSSTQVNVQSFISTFMFQLTNANADGFTFTVQSIGSASVGRTGGGLGYAGIGNSVAVGFQLYSAGNEVNLVGLWTNGASPDATPGMSMSSSSINLHSGDMFKVILSYNGTTLSMYIRDLNQSNFHFFTSFPIDIPGTVGSNVAYVGFTAGDGGLTSTQDILSWSYINTTGTSGTFVWPVDSPAVVGAADYATTAFGDQYETATDICPGAAGCQRGEPVYASASGTVQAVYVTSDPAQTMCDGSPTGSLPTADTHLGNTVIISHSNGKFSLYGNLDCVWPGIAPGVQVSQGTRIGNIGNSQYNTRYNTWTSHLHFEIKDKGVIGDPATGTFAGFTADLPDGYGYHDPRVYIFPFSQTGMVPTAVKVVASRPLNVLTGPDVSYSSLPTFVAPGQEFVAFASSGSWYEIYLPNSEGPVSGWIPASAGTQILVQPDPSATIMEVTNAGGKGLVIQPTASAATNLVSWVNNSGFEPFVQNCTPAAKIWDGQYYVSLATQDGFNEFYLPSNFYLNSANTCAQPSGPGPSVGWASSVYFH